MKSAIVVFPGSNRENDVLKALRLVGSPQSLQSFAERAC